LFSGKCIIETDLNQDSDEHYINVSEMFLVFVGNLNSFEPYETISCKTEHKEFKTRLNGLLILHRCSIAFI